MSKCQSFKQIKKQLSFSAIWDDIDPISKNHDFRNLHNVSASLFKKVKHMEIQKFKICNDIVPQAGLPWGSNS